MDKPTLLFDKALIFRHIPLFSDLNIFERRMIFDALEIVDYKSGETIYAQGDAPDAFYCVISGRVEVFVSRDGREEVLEHIHRGKYFGFISLLTGEPHSVSVRAVNDTVMARIPQDRFKVILHKIPRLAIDLSRMLSRRLKRRDIHPKTIFESTIVSFFGDPLAREDTALYALNLALGLKKETGKKIILIDFSGPGSVIGRALGFDASRAPLSKDQFYHAQKIFDHVISTSTGVDVLVPEVQPSGRAEVAPFIALVTTLVNDYHFCLVHLPYDFGPQVFKVLAQSDAVHLVLAPEYDAVRKMARLLDMAGLSRDRAFKKKIRLLMVEEGRTHGRGEKFSACSEESLFHLPVYATLPPQESGRPFLVTQDPLNPYAKVIRRISRQMGEVLVGLALGCGSAMGLAHIGVLQVLEEEGVPIDIVCGSSIGAMFGAFWAAGYSAGEIQTIVLKNNRQSYLFGWDDLAFPLRGLIRGRHVKNFLTKYFGRKTFCDLKMPFRAVACDCRTMQQVVFESGSLVDAVLSSIAIPGVFSPHVVGGRYLIDGGILNPLPTDVLLEAGAKKVISVNVLPSGDEIERTYDLLSQRRVKPDFLRQGVWRYPWYFFRHRFHEWLDPNIFSIIVSTIQSMEYLLAQVSSLGQSDVALHPDMTGVSWSDFAHAEELMARGRQEARRCLPRIQSLVSRPE
ncbi:MAG: cyclic nucleotide-binding domain-containing protein [Candidatus Omnitrophica bacterium]|nr:cyclic nucleotide-binding domain-containing protein [Candidatus Omnitrophota bacterium]MDD5574587.1 cyclic nucleotide-binding domain-containing protein [Candidatus Omnitrophota bacterium]